jgi:polysaccharide pyruvyl transferase WcaK-like protein
MFNLFCIRPKGFNIGNDAIFTGLQYFIHAAFGQMVNLISLPATSRYESQAKGGLTAKTIYEINQYGHGVIVGGGNLYENGELDVTLDALKSLEAPLMLVSLSRGRIYNRRNQLVERTDVMPDRVLKAINDRADYSMARDHVTHAHLQGLGCKKVQLGACPTLFLNRLENHLPPLFAHDRGEVLISLRHPSLMNISLQKQAQVVDDIRGIVAHLRATGRTDIRLLCHDHRDLTFAASFPDLEYVYTADIYSYLSLLRGCALNITYRLHSALPCFSFGTPAIHIGYDERANSLMETVGLGAWNLDMVTSKNTVADVIDRIERIAEFPKVRQEASLVWEKYHDVMTQTFAAFASDVVKFREHCTQPS